MSINREYQHLSNEDDWLSKTDPLIVFAAIFIAVTALSLYFLT